MPDRITPAIPAAARQLINEGCGAIRLAEYVSGRDLTPAVQDAIWLAWSDYEPPTPHVRIEAPDLAA